MQHTWLEEPWVLVLFVLNSVFATQVLIHDLRAKNRQMGALMKVVWILTVVYSGFLGLAIYFYAGRRQIRSDSLWRRGFRSVAHCFSGCGGGEVVGVLWAASLGLGSTLGTFALTFSLAYLAGLALTVGPLLSDGAPFATAVKDGVLTESASIIVMEVVAISVDLNLARGAGPSEVRFWTVLFISLAAGLLAAYPVNLLLIRRGIKAGMHDPRTV